MLFYKHRSILLLKECEVLLELAEVRLSIGPLSSALQLAQDLLKMSQTHCLGMEFNIELLLGHAFRATGKFGEACEHYKKAEFRTSLSPCEDSKILAFIYQQICTYEMGKNTEALSKLSPLVSNPSLSNFTEGLLNEALGSIYRSIANWHSAVQFFEESIRLADEAGDKVRVAERRALLGRVYRSSGQYQRALELQEQFYEFALSRGDKSSLASACGFIGFTNYSLTQPDYDKAVTFLATRLHLSTELEDRQGFRWCLNNIGKCYLDLKRPEISLELFRVSAEIAKELNSLLGEGTAYGNMGTAFRALKRHRDAVTYHLLYAENAEKRLDTGGMAIMQNELALDYLLVGDLDSARKYCLLALKTGLEIRARLSQEDDVLKISNFDKNQAKAYAMLQCILVRQGLIEASLLVSEMGRARALADLVKRGSKASSSFLEKIDQIVDEEGNISPEAVAEAMREVGLLVRRLKSNLVVYSLVESPADEKVRETNLYTWLVQCRNDDDRVEVTFRSVVLGEVEAAKSSFVLNESYYSNLVREVGVEGSNFASLEHQSLHEVSLTATDKSSNDRSGPESDGATRDIKRRKKKVADAREDKLTQLYNLLVSPIEAHIARESEVDVPRVTLIPQGHLFNVPFPALKGPRGYMIQQFVISLSPSMYLLHLASGKGVTSPFAQPDSIKALIVGDPKMPLESISQLPGAQTEADTIHSIIGGKLLCGAIASKAAVIAHLPSHNVIHLATHAILGNSVSELDSSDAHRDGDYSIKGAVVLAKSDASCSGILTSTEIQKLPLSSELVVLSCCRTGRGKVTGDGILGLSRSIISAGADSLIVTLWAIHDDSSPILMERFYRQYKESRDGPSALREATLHLIKTGYGPGHWGAFCFLGVSPAIKPVNATH
ncbi:Tetratricopeptide repeat protein 28 [Geodia barretti]|uniref:Tetratricopeptide repeat protein 28 n=1 Tax=Geodia barretti TaxID=519541 RepID=A0AA35WSL8_GEOBA|nr:Tetratricopeptide repeat protein 28 [Geodia barretti]